MLPVTAVPTAWSGGANTAARAPREGPAAHVSLGKPPIGRALAWLSSPRFSMLYRTKQTGQVCEHGQASEHLGPRTGIALATRPNCVWRRPRPHGKQAEEEELLQTRLSYKLTRKIHGLSPIHLLPFLSDKKGCRLHDVAKAQPPALRQMGRREMPKRPPKPLPSGAPRASACGTRAPGRPRLLSARVPWFPHSLLWGWALGPPRTFLPWPLHSLGDGEQGQTAGQDVPLPSPQAPRWLPGTPRAQRPMALALVVSGAPHTASQRAGPQTLLHPLLPGPAPPAPAEQALHRAGLSQAEGPSLPSH